MLPSAIQRLAASAAYPEDEPELMLYGRLVGTWDVAWTRFGDDGAPAERRRAHWHFAWILGGRGVQDVIWQHGDPPHLDGTTIRCYDAEHRIWRLAFMSPGDGEFVTMVGAADGDRIVQELDGRPDERWTFSEITETSFLWQALRSGGDGGAWTVTHEMRATRTASGT